MGYANSFFTEFLPMASTSIPESPTQDEAWDSPFRFVTGTFLWTIQDGEDKSLWTTSFSQGLENTEQGELTVIEGGTSDAEACLSMSAETLKSLAEGGNFQIAFMKGLIRISGEMSLVMKFMNALLEYSGKEEDDLDNIDIDIEELQQSMG